MSISFTGTINSWSGGISSAIAKEARKLSLKPVKRVVFQFDPFLKESEQTRSLTLLNSMRLQDSYSTVANPGRNSGTTNNGWEKISALTTKFGTKVGPNCENYYMDFLFNISRTSLRKTNPACLLKTNVVCDRSDPSVSFSLENGSTVLFKSKNLSSLEMFQLYNKHITSLLPKDEPVAVAKTKAEKAALKKR